MVVYDDQAALVASWSSALQSGRASDVVVRGPSGTTIRCHRAVLSVFSKAFQDMFESGMADGPADCVDVKEVDPDALRTMIEFMYTGRCKLTSLSVIPLMAIADRFDVQPLRNFCGRYVLEELEITRANWLCLLRLSTAYKVPSVAVRLSDAFVGRIDMDAQDWLQVSPTELCALVSGAQQNREAMNFQLAQAVALWASHKEGRLEVGSDVLDRFDYSSFTLDEICKLSSLETVRGCPALCSKIVSSMATIGTKLKEHRKVNPNVWSQGQSGTWTAPSSGWFFILARGQGGQHCSHFRGGQGAVVGGAYLIRAGDQLLISAGGQGRKEASRLNSYLYSGHGASGGDASYVVSVPKGGLAEPSKLLMVAGGGGSAAPWGSGGSAVLEGAQGGGQDFGLVGDVCVGHGDETDGMAYGDIVSKLGQPLKGGRNSVGGGAGYDGGRGVPMCDEAPEADLIDHGYGPPVRSFMHLSEDQHASGGGTCFVGKGARNVVAAHSSKDVCEVRIFWGPALPTTVVF